MEYLIDPLAVKAAEREFKITFTEEQLDDARQDSGHLIVFIEEQARHVHFRFPVLRFPYDLIDTNPEDNLETTSIW